MKKLRPKFVELIPEIVEPGILYISIEYCTATHKCVCGCGNDVVTPLSPTDWELTFDGDSVSLSPSIGNWGFPCKSHYWIKKNKITQAGKWPKWKIEQNRNTDFERKKEYYKKNSKD
jgi:hypothetical protein